MDRENENSWKYFENRDCKYFPCHSQDPLRQKIFFNCLFCYCPLYLLGEDCGGNFIYTKDKIKNCSACLIPHETDDFYLVVKEKIFHTLNENIEKKS